jgi:DNA excision repair protein ERCC-2
METPPITVSVRALCEFTAKLGDLDLRFTPSPSALEGMQGHATVRRRRAAGASAYEAEVSLQGEYAGLLVRGRADGFDAALQQLEEIKTYRGDLAAQPANHRALHWAQLRIYGWLLCQQRGLAQLPKLRLALVYFDIVSQQETLVTESATADELHAHFNTQCARFLQWAEQEHAHRAQRDHALSALAFPHPKFRTGQRELAKAVYQVQRAGRCLLAQAPTGIGKTVGTLFPALKAMPGQTVDKLFFLTAKSSGRQLALDAAQQIQGAGAKQAVRWLELVARDKACEHPDKACHGESCPLAQGFYDRLAAARQSAVAQPLLDRTTLRNTALAHNICPYYLGQEMVRWSDVVVGDVNYYFDTSALLHSLAQQNDWRVTLLIDEAHNLLERARQMYSATLDHLTLRMLRRTAPAALQKPLDRLHRQWLALLKPLASAYTAMDAVPAKFLGALQNASNAIGEHFAEHPTDVEPALQRFQFDAAQFVRLAEGLMDTAQSNEAAATDVPTSAALNKHSLFDIQRPEEDPAASRLTMRCVVPAPHLAPRLANAHAAVLFSATLSPRNFYQDMLGLPANTAWIDVAAPFTADQLTVQVARHISTRYNDRAASLQPMAEQMAAQYTNAPGHYLAFFSSYDYLQQAADAFALHAPEVPIWRQSRRMLEAEQAQFLARFVPAGRGIGFAVLGGAFSEGIDLPGDRLIGAFIATLGLPQVNPVNEQFRERLQARFGRGYDYAYLYPGLQKVVQAAGRVIRTPEDQGTLLLLDQRFARAEVRRLLPAWWSLHKL